MVAWANDKTRNEPMARFPAFCIPKALHIAFKAKCAREGVSMAEVIRAAIVKYVDKESEK